MTKLLVNGKSFNINVLDVRSNKVLFEINNKNYLVEKATDTIYSSNQVVKVTKTNIKLGAQQEDILYSEIPGLINSIKVSLDTYVKQGDTILITEAMKMQNRILAHKDGIVKEIFVETGQEITKGHALVKIS